MIEADAPSTEEVVCTVVCTLAERARLTGGSHGLTIDAPAQRIKGAKLRAAPDRSKGAAKGIMKSAAP
jgi:hypothetical protein